MCEIFNHVDLLEDEIVEIVELDYEDTIDIETDGNHLFFANGILTHNSAVEEIEFDHSHISGGLSKIQTADNVIGIFTSRAMRERGRYQIQLMKTRSSSGVGSKIDLEFNVDTLRISSCEQSEGDTNVSNTMSSNISNILKRTSQTQENSESAPVKAEINSVRMRSFLNDLSN
jgi:hypothetical protein